LDKGIAVTATPQARNTINRDGRPPCEGYGTCIPLCPIRSKYESKFHVDKAIELGAKLWTKTIVTSLELLDANTPQRVVRANFKRWDNTTGSVRGKLFILAANGIETPKLLLMSRQAGAPFGLANNSSSEPDKPGLVGRNLMDHPLKASYA